MTDKNLFYKKFKKQREKLGYSLEKIAEKTKINIKFLRALEQGNFDVLPQTYIKLFIKSYAEELNLDASEILEEFEKYKFKEGLSSSKPDSEKTEPEEKKVNKLSITPGGNKKNLTTILIIIISFFIIIFFLKRVLEDDGDQNTDTMPLNVSEIPIEEEQADTLEKMPAQKINPDTAQVINTNQDSLVLEVSFQDSCWMNIITDEKDTLDAIYVQNNEVELRAREKYKMKIGKPQAISAITLNGRDLGPVGNDTPVVLYINKNGIYRRSSLE